MNCTRICLLGREERVRQLWRDFAKSLNWEDGPSLNVPEDSEIGKSIMESRCRYYEIDGASNNSVDQVESRDE